MSYFSIDKVANLAANDFLRSPVLMMSAYLEWSAGATALAKSGRLSHGASAGIRICACPCLARLRCVLRVHTPRSTYLAQTLRITHHARTLLAALTAAAYP